MTVIKDRPITGNTELAFARRAKVDPSVTELGDNAPVVAIGLAQLLVSLALCGMGAWVLIFGTGEASSEAMQEVKEIERWAVGSALVAIGILIGACSNMVEASKAKENKALHQSIKGSRQVASKLGTPVLRKDFVEARVRIDTTLRLKRAELALKWEQSEADAIGTLLFQDMMQESTIKSLIKDRGLTTAAEIKAALLEMEAASVKPMQDGWL